MRKRILVVAAVVLVVLVAAWVALNPCRRFGMSSAALTTYNRVPLPLVDFQVRGDGAVRLVGKTHAIDAKELAWLATPAPEVVIIAAGWEGDAHAVARPPALLGTRILTLPTGEALKLFNALRGQGVRVAIHVHSTC